MNRRNAVNIIFSAIVSVGFVLLGFLVFSSSYLRAFEAGGNLIDSIKFYFSELFGIAHNTAPAVNAWSEVMKWDILLPSDFDTFKVSAVRFFELLVDKENFIGYWSVVGDKSSVAAKVIAIALPCVLVFVFALKRLYANGNTKHGKDTLPLKAFKLVSRATYQPVKRFVLGYIDFLKHTNWLWICWLVLWAFHLNLVSIVLGFFAYYFYFSVSFDIASIYTQACKLFIDLQVIFRHFPWWSIATIAWLIFNRWRKSIALNRLRHFEARNCGFINEVPIVSISCGSMGKKKTTLITDMVLSQEVMFRQKAYDILKNNDMKFPMFPWIAFEDELRLCMKHGTMYNLATVKEWVKLKENRYLRNGRTDLQLYGYDICRYGATYNDGLKISTLFEVLETYAQAYFIYVIESSLIVSNYSIREDNEFVSEGNFPIWASDFFPEGITEGRHAHILDFDVLRLGKKVMENNPKAGSFEFGVVAISEIGKERGNNLELKEVKKGTEETNQKNDLFNAWLKMCRHSATVDNFPFIKVFTDEQRPESWGADARDLCDIIHIVQSGDQRLALPFYTIEEMISEWIFNRFIALYYDFRFRRGDNTLLVYILKGVTSWIWRRNVRIFNRFGYSILKIEKERGTMDGKPENKKYYLMNKKIYSRRFSTDCFSDYFNDMAKKTDIGLMDYMEYVTEKASVEELKMQNSYFINSLYREADETGSAR